MTTALAIAELRTIRLYGTLAQLVGCRTLKAAVSSVPEAMKFLMANFPQVAGHLKGRFFRVKVADWVLKEDELSTPVGQSEDICIIPAICGAGGNGPLTGILAGAALIGIGLLIPFTGSLLIPLGIGLLLTGIAELISPTPKVQDEDNDPSRSYNFSGLQQTSREGVPVPLVYGEIFTGSVTISAKVEQDEDDGGLSGGGAAGGGVFTSGTGNPNPSLPPFGDGSNVNPNTLAQDYPGGWRVTITKLPNAIWTYGDSSINTVSFAGNDWDQVFLTSSSPVGWVPKKGSVDWLVNSTAVYDSGLASQEGATELVYQFFRRSISTGQLYSYRGIYQPRPGPTQITGYVSLYKTGSDFTNNVNATIWSGGV